MKMAQVWFVFVAVIVPVALAGATLLVFGEVARRDVLQTLQSDGERGVLVTFSSMDISCDHILVYSFHIEGSGNYSTVLWCLKPFGQVSCMK